MKIQSPRSASPRGLLHPCLLIFSEDGAVMVLLLQSVASSDDRPNHVILTSNNLQGIERAGSCLDLCIRSPSPSPAAHGTTQAGALQQWGLPRGGQGLIMSLGLKGLAKKDVPWFCTPQRKGGINTSGHLPKFGEIVNSFRCLLFLILANRSFSSLRSS